MLNTQTGETELLEREKDCFNWAIFCWNPRYDLFGSKLSNI